MKFLKIKLLVIALVMFAANSAFAALSYNVSVDTTSLNTTSGYLYFQYGGFNAVDSTATLYSFNGGALAADNSANVVDGSAVTGKLPNSVYFANTNGTNDYNHGITFGSDLKFSVAFASTSFGATNNGNSTFSLGLFSDEAGLSPLVSTLFTIDLNNDATTVVGALANGVDVTPTPIPAAIWLLGSGLMGLVGVRRRTA